MKLRQATNFIPNTNFYKTMQNSAANQSIISPYSKNAFNSGEDKIKSYNYNSNTSTYGAKNSRIYDIGESFVNLFTEGLGGFTNSVIEGGSKIVSGIGQIFNPTPIKDLFSGNYSQAWDTFTENAANGFSNITDGLIQGVIQAPFDTAMVVLQNGVSAIQTAFGFEPPGRGLSADELIELKNVYGDSLDLSKIRIKEGDLGLNNLLSPHTVGNTIYIPSPYSSADLPLLVHESVHSWQYQNGGTDYIGSSLWNQFKGWVFGNDRNDAYEYGSEILAGSSWSNLNAEQQAHLIAESYQNNLFSDYGNKPLVYGNFDITNYALDAIMNLRNGTGAD
jgi:hypothetical protein